MIIPIAIAGAAALFLLSQSKDAGTTDTSTPAAVTELDADEYVTFNAGMGTSPLQNAALLALLPGETLPESLAADLGTLGYTELGVVVVDQEGFDPSRLRLFRTEAGTPIDETFATETLDEVTAEIAGRAAAVRERRASAGGRVPGETLSHGRGVLPDGEHGRMTGRGLIGGDPLRDVPHHMRPAMRREMRRLMGRGVTRNPIVAAKIAKRRVR